MSKSSSNHEPTISFMSWLPLLTILLFVGLIVGCVMGVQSLYPDMWLQEALISEPVSMQPFSLTPIIASSNTTPNTICLWIETSPSMAGYLSDPRDASYPQTFFELIVRHPQQILSGDITNTEIVRYAFNPGFALRLEKNWKGTVDELVSKQIITDYESLLTTDYFFQDLTTDANALATVFEVLDPSCINVIITDMIEHRDVISVSSELQKRYESAFQNDLTMDIIGFEDTYSGFLFEVGDPGQVYAFGVGSKKGFDYSGDSAHYLSQNNGRINAQSISLGAYTNSPHPRPLYIIVIGTTPQCDALSETIMNLYGDYRDEINRTKGLILKPKPDSSEILPEARRFSFHRRSLQAVLDTAGHTAITRTIVPDDSNVYETFDEVDYERQKLHADEADSVRLIKDLDQTTQTYTLTYQFKPELENFDATYDSDDYHLGDISLRRLEFFPFGDDEETLKVHTLGDQYLGYQAVPCSVTDSVSVSDIHTTLAGITLQVTINVSTMDAGYYRIDIPVVYDRDVGKLENTLDTASLADWYCTADEFPSRKYNYCTPNLRTQLQLLCRAQEACLNKTLRIANISLDFEIKLK